MTKLLRPYTETRYAHHETACCVLFLLALVWLVIVGAFGVNAFVLTAGAGVFAGAVFGSFFKRHTEPGLWMLALLFGAFVAATYLVAAAVMIRDAINGQSSTRTALLAIDIALAGVLAQIASRACWTVFVQNRQLPPKQPG